jgi:hypothetical protein
MKKPVDVMFENQAKTTPCSIPEHLREREKLGGEVERRALAVRAEREEFRAETEELESE